MGQYLEDVVGEGRLPTFLGFWSVMGKWMASTHSVLPDLIPSDPLVLLYGHRACGPHFMLARSRRTHRW